METVSKTSTQCKCGNLSPLRVARVDALLAHLGCGETIVGWNLYSGLRGTLGWPRATVDQALNDVVVLGKARLYHEGCWIVVEVFSEEQSCLAS